LAEELNLTAGDSIELGWYVTDDNQRQRLTANASVLKVVANTGQGAAAGTSTPALFTDLNTAQRLQQLDGRVNTLHYAVATSHEHAAGIEPIIEALELHLDDALTAESIGLQFDVDGSTDTISVSSTSGLGRLAGTDVVALRENTTSLGIDTVMEVLQVPLVDLSLDDESLLTLANNQPNELVIGERGLWHSSPSGFGVQIDGLGDAWVWRVPDGGALYDFTLSSDGQFGGGVHAGGMVIGSEQDIDAEEWASYSSDASMRTLVSDSSGWWAIEADDEALLLHHFSHDLSTHEERHKLICQH